VRIPFKTLPPLKENVENEIIKEWQSTKDPVLLDKLIRHNAPYIMTRVRRLRAYSPQKTEDMFQEGVYGFIKALERWNPDKSKSRRFMLYASWEIDHRIKEFITNNFKVVNIGHNDAVRSIFFNRQSVVNGTVRNKNNKRNEFTEERIEEAVHLFSAKDKEIDPDRFVVRDIEQDLVNDIIDRKRVIRKVRIAVSRLKEKGGSGSRRKVVSEILKGKTLSQISREMGLSKERVSQIFFEARKVLKEQLKEFSG
jgi:RNA polymerase sigma factor (sigma-70 family)